MDTRQLLTIELARQHNLKMQNTSLHIKSVGAIALCLSGLATPWMPVAAQEAASGAVAAAAPPNAASPPRRLVARLPRKNRPPHR
ncbi:hypothetical protein GPU89_37835 [Burkholderia cepacia]|nr:hypothetical protein [Burkholderia cepacia]